MRIQQAAFAKGKAFLKGALHCHTTRSDGKGTPEEVIKLHYEKGYQFTYFNNEAGYGALK